MKKLTKILCAILTVCMMLTIMPFGAFAANGSVSFTDTKGNWAETCILYWANHPAKDGNGYVIGGYADGTFRPDDNITRGAVAAILDRAISSISATGATKDFNDVAKGSTFYKNIMACADSGVINGYSDGSFKPGNSITRQAAIAMIARCVMDKSDYEKYSDKTASKKFLSDQFKDAGSISEQFYAEFCYMRSSGSLDGYNDGTVRPGQNITRAQFVKLLYSVINKESSDPVVAGKTYTLKVTLSEGNTSLSASTTNLQSNAIIVKELMNLACANFDEIAAKFPPATDAKKSLTGFIATYNVHNPGKWDDTSKANWNNCISADGDAAITSACKNPEDPTTISTLYSNHIYTVKITDDAHTYILTVILATE